MPADAMWSGFSFHVRPFEYYAGLASRFGFSIQSRGQIRDFGYPEHIDLTTNLLLEFRALPAKASPVGVAFPGTDRRREIAPSVKV